MAPYDQTHGSQSSTIDSDPPCSAMRSFGEAALCWFRYGFNVIPIKPGEKITAVKWDPWLDGLSAEKIEAYWAQHPDHEVGFIVGDDIIVFDADTPQAGAALAEIEESFDLTPTLIVKTSRGAHHYFQRPLCTFAKTDSHSTTEHLKRIDIKTGRSMMVLPPSTNKFVEINEARNAGELAVANQAFIDAIFRHNGREAPRRPPIPQRPSPSLMCDDEQFMALSAMLDHIDSDCAYDDWVRVLMAIHNETAGRDEGLALADAWSSRGSKYSGVAELRAKWSSFAGYSRAPVTVATIRKMLADKGIDWMAICAAAGPDFEPCETIVVRPDEPPLLPIQRPQHHSTSIRCAA